MTLFYIILYILLGIIFGSVVYVFIYDSDDEDTPGIVLCSLAWPITLPLGILCIIIYYLCDNFVKLLEIFKKYGIHYYLGSLPTCCFTCKKFKKLSGYARCALHNKIINDEFIYICSNYNKDKFWRFTYKVK